MSDYLNHPAFTRLEQLKKMVEGYDSSSLDEQSIKNFGRFKKALAYIDTLLQNSDYELIPKNVLDNINNQLSSCVTHFNNFQTHRNSSYLQQANQNIDNVLSALKPYTFYDKKLKRTLREAIKAYIDEIDHHLQNIANTEEEYEKARKYREEIQSFYESLFSGDDNHKSAKEQIEEFLEKAEKQYKQINSFYNETLIDEDGQLSTKTEIESAKSEILRDLKEARNRLVEVSSKIEDFEKFYIKVFGSEDEEGNRKGGLEAELAKKLNELDAYSKKQTEIHNKLLADIENLLEGATNAGLASAYQKRRESYEGPVQWWDFVFIVSLAGMFVAGYLTLKDFKDITETLKHLLEYSPMYIPAIWLAFYASKRRSESRAFEEEYAHKEALAKSYVSYKKQIEELGKENDELMKKMLDKAIDTISDNPTSRVLEGKHGDDMPLMKILKEIKEILLEFKKK